MNIKNNISKQNSRLKIDTAFMKLVQAGDVKDITVSKICKLAKVNRSTFYACYQDIFHLIEKIGEKAFNDFYELNKDDSMSDYIHKLLYHIEENQLFYKTFTKLRSNNYYGNKLFHIVDEDKNKKKLKDNKYVEYNAEFVNSGINSIITLWLNRDCDISSDELYKIIEKFKACEFD